MGSNIERTKKVPVNISVNSDIDSLFRKMTIKEISINNEKVVITKTLNDIYNRALEHAVEHIDEWWQ